MSLKVRYSSQYNQPEHVKNAIAELQPKVDTNTRFVLKGPDDPAFQPNQDDDTLQIVKLNALSGKTELLETDGEVKYGSPINFGDGTSQKVTIKNWNYVLLVNKIKERGDNYNTVKTCYIKDREVFAGLRVAVGLTAF